MKISIVTVSYNSELTIRDTLVSVEKQVYKNYEHIIIDGGSKDKTIDIVKKFPHVTKIISEKDNGIYDAMNKGIKNATGEVIGFLNSDDFFKNENTLQIISKPFKQNDVDFVYGDIDYISFDKTKVIRNWITGEYKNKAFLKGWSPPHPTFYCKKTMYDIKKYKVDIGSPADFELMFYFFQNKQLKFSYLREKLVQMRIGGDSNQSIIGIIKQNLTIINILKNYNRKQFSLLSFLINKFFLKIKQYK